MSDTFQFNKTFLAFGFLFVFCYVIYSTTLFAENFCKDSLSLFVFSSRTNLKLHDISVTPEIVKKVIMNLDSSKTSASDCISVVVLKNCEPELPNVLGEIFNKCLKESCFPDCWNISSVFPVFKNGGEGCAVKNYHPVSLCMVSRVFEKLLNNRIVNQQKKCAFFLISCMF